MPELISPTEYARRRGCCHTSVLKAIRTGRISLIDGKIDPVAANAQWQANTRHRTRIPPADAPTPEPATPQRPDSAIPRSEYDLHKSRAKREHHEANLAEMRERQKAGELVELAEVEQTTATIFAQLCNAMENIGDKIGDRLAAETDPFVCRTLINDELNQIRADLAAALTAQADRLKENPDA